MSKTLAELKAENAALENEEQQQAEVDDHDEELDEVDESQEETTENADQDDQEGVEKEAWETQEDEKSSGAKFTDKDMAAQRHALQAKFEKKKNDELEALKAQIEALKSGRQQDSQPTVVTMPKPEDFDFDDAKYQAAMQAWIIRTTQQAQQSEQANQQKLQAEQRLKQQVDAHYERAAKLVTERGIDPDRYRQADLNLRKTMEEAFPGAGEIVTDQLLSRIGEGSEKLGFYLGNNAADREKLKQKMIDDPSGLSASIFLGSLLPQLTTPPKKKTSAPDPAARAEGGSNTTLSGAALKKKYDATKDISERIRIKRLAKASGAKTDDWN